LNEVNRVLLKKETGLQVTLFLIWKRNTREVILAQPPFNDTTDQPNALKFSAGGKKRWITCGQFQCPI